MFPPWFKPPWLLHGGPADQQSGGRWQRDAFGNWSFIPSGFGGAVGQGNLGVFPGERNSFAPQPGPNNDLAIHSPGIPPISGHSPGVPPLPLPGTSSGNYDIRPPGFQPPPRNWFGPPQFRDTTGQRSSF